MLRLSSVAEWKTLPPAEVVAADRIGRWRWFDRTEPVLASQYRYRGVPVKCGIGITQLQDKVPHEATMKELERAKRE